MTNEHPVPEELLLWQSGELDPHEAEAIQAHVYECAQCQERLEKHAQTYEEVAWVSDRAAHRRMRVAIRERVRRRVSLPPMLTTGVAAVLIVAVVLFSMDLTPSARADTLLDKAALQQSEEQVGQVSVLLRFNDHACVVSASRQLVSLAGSENASCQGIAAQFDRVGWTGSDALSASSFRAWRKSLAHKSDAIHKAGDTTEIQTETNEAPIHKAMLRLRDSDDHPVAARYEFAADGSEPAAVIEVGEETGPPPVLIARSSPEPVPPPAEPHPHPSPVAVANPLDDAEARAWLALSRAGLDSDVLVAVNREPDAVRIWGVVPTQKAQAALTGALQNQPETQVDVTVEGHSGYSPQSLPWTAWRGDAPPLAADQLQAQFPDNPQASQQFLNDMDALTRRLVAETKSRDAMLVLAARMPDSDSASSLRTAAAQLDASITVDLSSVAGKLGPFLSSAPPSAVHPLSYQQATQLYTLVHELFFMSRSRDALDRDGAWAQVRNLFSGRPA